MYWWENSLTGLFAYCSKQAFTNVREPEERTRETAITSDDVLLLCTPTTKSRHKRTNTFRPGLSEKRSPMFEGHQSCFRMVGMREISPPHPSTWKSFLFNRISLMYRPDPPLLPSPPPTSLSKIPYQGCESNRADLFCSSPPGRSEHFTQTLVCMWPGATHITVGSAEQSRGQMYVQQRKRSGERPVPGRREREGGETPAGQLDSDGFAVQRARARVCV